MKKWENKINNKMTKTISFPSKSSESAISPDFINYLSAVNSEKGSWVAQNGDFTAWPFDYNTASSSGTYIIIANNIVAYLEAGDSYKTTDQNQSDFYQSISFFVGRSFPNGIVTISPNGIETIENKQNLKIWGREFVKLLYDGATWVVIDSIKIPMSANMRLTGNQLLVAGNQTKLLINNGDSFVSAPTSMIGTNRIICKRDGVYDISFRVKMNTTNASQTNITITVKKDGTTDILDAIGTQAANGNLTLSSNIKLSLIESNYIELYASSSAGTYITSSFISSILSVVEIPT